MRIKFILIFLILMLSGCVNTMPKDQAIVESKITIKHDPFKKETSIYTPLFLSRQGFTDTFPVNIKFRALIKEEEILFIQLYVTKMDLT